MKCKKKLRRVNKEKKADKSLQLEQSRFSKLPNFNIQVFRINREYYTKNKIIFDLIANPKTFFKYDTKLNIT